MDKYKKGFNIGEAIVPGIALIFAIAYFIQTNDAPLVAIRWPYIIAILVFILWLIVVKQFVFKVEENKKNIVILKNINKKPLVMLVLPVVYIFMMQYLGFALSSLLFLVTFFKILGSSSWVRNIIVALIVVGTLHFALNVLMQMSFPSLGINIGSVTF